MDDDYLTRMTAFEHTHIIETIEKMAEDLRRSATALDRISKDERATDAWRAQSAWGELRNMTSNLRVDILIASLGRLIDIANDKPGD